MNTKKWIKVISIITMMFFANITVADYFEDVGRDPRARGMANAMVAMYSGIHSMHYNPAGTSRSLNFEITSIYGKPLTVTELSDGSSFSTLDFGVLMPFTNSVNLSWLIRWLFYGLTFGNESFFFKNGVTGLSFYHRNSANLVSETRITFNYSKILDDVLFKGAKLSAGFNFDFYMLSFNSTEDWAYIQSEFGASMSKMAFGLDLGIMYDFAKNIRLGAVFENLIQPNFSVFPGGSDKSPMNVKLGAAMMFDELLFFEDLTLTVNYVTFGKYDPDDNTVSRTAWMYAFESWWFEHMFAFRGGVQLGDDESSEITAGITFDVVFGDHEISLDYAFSLPLGVTGTRHLFSLTWKKAIPKYSFIYDEKRAAELKRIEELKRKQEEEDKKKKNKIR